MTPIHIEVRDATQWAAKQYLDRQELTPERRREIQHLTEYNILAYSFNASTVLLAVASVAAVFFSFTAAAVFGAVGLFVRFTASNELENLAKPGGMDALAHAVNQTAPTPQERIRNICHKLHIERPGEDWTETLISIFGHAVWRRTISQETPVIPQDAQAPRQRGLRGIAHMIMQQQQQHPAEQQPAHPQEQQQQHVVDHEEFVAPPEQQQQQFAGHEQYVLPAQQQQPPAAVHFEEEPEQD